MPLFKVEIFKSYQGEEWANVYHIRCTDLAEAVTGGNIVVTGERGCHPNTVTFVRLRVADLIEGNDQFVTVPLLGGGSLDGSGDPLPLFNTLRVDFEVDGAGRPSRKFFRGVLVDGSVTFNTVSSALRTAVDTALTTMITNLSANNTPYVDVDDQEVTNAVVWDKVQMRQLHRKRRRAAVPA